MISSWENSQDGILSQDPLTTLGFGLLIIDILSGLIQLYMCERCKSLLWLLNKNIPPNYFCYYWIGKNVRD